MENELIEEYNNNIIHDLKHIKDYELEHGQDYQYVENGSIHVLAETLINCQSYFNKLDDWCLKINRQINYKYIKISELYTNHKMIYKDLYYLFEINNYKDAINELNHNPLKYRINKPYNHMTNALILLNSFNNYKSNHN